MEKNCLQIMLDTQNKLQERIGTSPLTLPIRERMKFVKEHSFWVIDEIHEMVHELPFMKHWSKKHDNLTEEELELLIEAGKKEFIDVLTFLMNVGLGLGFTGEEMMEEYLAKNCENHRRQDTGY